MSFTNENFSPYGCGMTAQHAVEALWRAHGIPETLKSYIKVIEQDTPPTYAEADNDSLFWFNTQNKKLYRASKNTTLQILVFFELSY